MNASLGHLDYRFSSIDRKWWRMLSTATDEVLVFSPYLTPRTALAVASTPPEVACAVHTVFNVLNFVSGASSARSLRDLVERGVALYHIPRLHAKVVIVKGRCATLGSQNLTAMGVRNREASVVVSDPAHVARITELVQPWLEERLPISMEMLDEVIGSLPRFRRTYRRLERECMDLHGEIVRAQAERVAAEEARVAELEDLRRMHRKRVASAITCTKAMEGTVPLTLARQFIRNSAWWLTQRWGPARAPGDADRIEGPAEDLRIELSAHPFLVSRAIRRCGKEIRRALEAIEHGGMINREELMQALRRHVRGAVATPNGYEYAGYYDHMRGQHMVFGAHSINVDDFAEEAIKVARLEEWGLVS